MTDSGSLIWMHLGSCASNRETIAINLEGQVAFLHIRICVMQVKCVGITLLLWLFLFQCFIEILQENNMAFNTFQICNPVISHMYCTVLI